jgi:hypothetical protein
MATNNMPQCQHCFGTSWTKVVILSNDMTTANKLCLWQCGHGAAGAEEMKNGCSRVIAATDEQMSHGGTI